jgi:zinc transport system substrate-binding protein
MLDKPMRRIPAGQQVVLAQAPPAASGHPWLGVEAASAIVLLVSERLQSRLPGQAVVLQDLQLQLTTSLASSFKQAEQALSAGASHQFMALHDAYQPLVEEFELEPLGYLVDVAGNRAGARSLWRISEQLEPLDSVCVLTQPQYSVELLNGLDIENRAVLAELDPMAGAAYNSDQGFAIYYAELLQTLVNCLNDAASVD